jgi:hypothetical protein
MGFRPLSALVLLLMSNTLAEGAIFHRSPSGSGGSAISLRKRLHVDTLITEPGTFEIDWAGLYSVSTGNYQSPTGFKFTPEGRHVIWGRTEYSVSFDSLDLTDSGGGRLTQFSQSTTFSATSVLHDGQKLDFAIAPQATVFLRDESGVRLGATAIARYDSGRDSLGVTAGWSGATVHSPANPAGVFDVGLGYGRNLSGAPWLEKFTPHGNIVWERATGLASAISVFEGIEYQMTKQLALDVSGQHFSVSGGQRDNQLVFGVTFNFGHPKARG